MADVIEFPRQAAPAALSPLDHWSIDVEDGVRMAIMAVDVMREGRNPLALTNLLRPYVGEKLPPQVIGIMHHLASRIMGKAG